VSKSNESDFHGNSSVCRPCVSANPLEASTGAAFANHVTFMDGTAAAIETLAKKHRRVIEIVAGHTWRCSPAIDVPGVVNRV
jgi:hypothetical protein